MNFMTSATMAVALIAGVTICPTAWADEAPQRTKQRDQAGKLDAKPTGTNVRVSHMMGQNIQNAEGKAVGEINDIVLDAGTGRIRYVAVTYGGLLGVGNKMFAVPYEAFECKANPDDHTKNIVVLDVTQKQLEGATGFDEDHWPDFADNKFTMELDKRYRIDRTRRNRNHDRDGAIDVKVSSDGVDIDLDDKDK